MYQCSRYWILLICLFSLTNNIHAQFNETIRTGRPGQAIGPFAVGKSVFQLQAGLDFNSNEEPNLAKSNTWTAPNAVLRFGISRTVDLNMVYEYQSGYFQTLNSVQKYHGLSVGGIGARIHLFGIKPKQTKIGVQLTALLPKLSNYFVQNKIHPAAKLIIAQNIGTKFTSLVNIGSVYNADVDKLNHSYVLNLGYTINNYFSVFIENYGGYSNAQFNNKWDTGIAYTVNHNLQLDLYGGYFKNGRQIDKFVSAGVSWRLLCLNKKSTTKEN